MFLKNAIRGQITKVCRKIYGINNIKDKNFHTKKYKLLDNFFFIFQMTEILISINVDPFKEMYKRDLDS